MNNASGWSDAGAGHVTDVHQYPGPSMPALERSRAAVLGEFGGLGLPTRGHTWQDEKNWGYVSFKSPAELQQAYQDRIAELRLLVARGLSAAVYTQTTDVEIETNGLMTYDREVVKIPQATLETIHRTLYKDLPAVRTLLPTSELDGRAWRYTTDEPAASWPAPGFDDGAWQTGTAPFGGGKPEGVPLRTPWTSPRILAAPVVRLDGRERRGALLRCHARRGRHGLSQRRRSGERAEALDRIRDGARLRGGLQGAQARAERDRRALPPDAGRAGD